MEKQKLLNTINPLLMDRNRLGLLVALSESENAIDFNTMIDLTGLTKGNLSSHVQKLEEAQLINVKKEFIERKPRTTYEITQKGKEELRNYLKILQTVLSK